MSRKRKDHRKYESRAMNFNVHMKACRIEKGLTQDELGVMSQVTGEFIGLIERGERLPSLDTFVDIVNALEASADRILCDDVTHGYEVRMSEYIERAGRCPAELRNRIFEYLDVMLKGY